MTESNAAAANGAAVQAASPGAGVAVHNAEDGAAEPAAVAPKTVARDQDPEQDAPAGLTRGIWWAAALLPFLSVLGAVLCFAAGVLNTGGCQANGSALCTGGGQWFTFVLPLLVAPLTAAVTAIGAVTFHRHRSTWLAVGYFVVFVSLLIGLAAANSGTG